MTEGAEQRQLFFFSFFFFFFLGNTELLYFFFRLNVCCLSLKTRPTLKICTCFTLSHENKASFLTSCVCWPCPVLRPAILHVSRRVSRPPLHHRSSPWQQRQGRPEKALRLPSQGPVWGRGQDRHSSASRGRHYSASWRSGWILGPAHHHTRSLVHRVRLQWRGAFCAVQSPQHVWSVLLLKSTFSAFWSTGPVVLVHFYQRGLYLLVHFYQQGLYF